MKHPTLLPTLMLILNLNHLTHTPGEYLVHMVWRGYRDVIDVDVLPSEANDRYGRAAAGVTWIKTDHCQYQRGTYESEGRKSWRVPGRTCFPLWPGNGYNASACLQACVDRGTSKCEAANVVPLNNPSGVVDFLVSCQCCNSGFERGTRVYKNKPTNVCMALSIWPLI